MSNKMLKTILEILKEDTDDIVNASIQDIANAVHNAFIYHDRPIEEAIKASEDVFNVLKSLEEIEEVKNDDKKLCPYCDKYYDERPALSRKDNKTKICPECGLKESVFEYMENRDKL